MQVELVAPGDFESAFGDWERLFILDELATPFASPAWGRTWLELWDPHAEPWLMRVRDGDRVAGIAPLALRHIRGARLLTMIGKEPGDYWDVIAAPQDREAVAVTVAAELARHARRWDAAVISCLPPESRTLELFSREGLRLLRRPLIRSPAISLPATFDDYLGSLPRSRRANLRRHLRRLDTGEVALREIRDLDEVPSVMRTWRDLRARQWRAMNKRLNPEHAKERFNVFMVEAARRLIERNLAVLWEFRHRGRVGAVYLNFADARSFYWYLGGFEPRLAALGLGKIAIGASLRESIAAGRVRYDFTRGEDSYKYWYGAQDRLLASVVVGHGTARSRLALRAARALIHHRGARPPTRNRGLPRVRIPGGVGSVAINGPGLRCPGQVPIT